VDLTADMAMSSKDVAEAVEHTRSFRSLFTE
jgi:hypothetical protein